MKMWTLLCILLAHPSFVGFFGVEAVDASVSVSANFSASSPVAPSPDPRPENLAAIVRRFTGGLVDDVPPWVRQRLREAPVSTECSFGLLKMLRGLSDLEPWALRMLDSTGKFPSGVFTGTVTELGSFDECLQTVVRDRHSADELVRAQYCSLFIITANESSLSDLFERPLSMTHPKAPSLLKYQEEQWTQMGLRWGMCVTSDCTQEEWQIIANALIETTAKVEVKYCMTGLPPDFTTTQIAFTIMFVAILLLIAAGTFVDLYSADKTKAKVGASVLKSFSISSNLRLLAFIPSDKTSDSYTLRFFHGIRAISIFHIVYGHSTVEYAFASGGAMHNPTYGDRFDSTLTTAGFLSVDTFFFMSGYLLSHGLSGLKSSQGRVKTTFIIALRRWYRLLLPMVFMACGISLLPLFVRGPTTDRVYDKFYYDVRSYWWSFLLNIRNFYRELTYGICVHLWYISADFQLFLPALIVHQLGLGRRFVIGALILLSLASSSFTAWQMYGTRHMPVIVQYPDKMEDYIYMLTDVYMLPTYHAACYFGGSITFFAVQNYKKEKISKGKQVAVWVAALVCGATCVFYRYDWTTGSKQHSDSAKMAVGFCDRIIWASALGGLTFLCACGRGGVIHRVLSAAPLAVLSRLSFGVYLVHIPFYYIWMNARRERNYINVFNFVSWSMVVFVWSCLLALCLFLACEAPLGRLDKLLWGSAGAPRQQKDTKEGVPEGMKRQDVELGTPRKEAAL
ncbi:O-acyltransferase like protein-like [Haemaphysalis longicornis]